MRCLLFMLKLSTLSCGLFLVLLTNLGCESGVKRVPAGGTVTLDGKPMTGGVLMFSPDVSKGNNYRVGCTGPISNGRFNLVTTGMDHRDNGSGAPPGWYKVTYFHPTEGENSDPSVPKVAAKYYSEETTPLTIELTDPPPPEGYKIELTSK
ncbi:MAG: hypothetical protein RMJ56_16895 [Gemmataceae bacterium]|nr:hypothetical protein [Gemmata sp.]MDW8199277.1 hypothetical protein [Gemmataceae bacterium]